MHQVDSFENRSVQRAQIGITLSRTTAATKLSTMQTEEEPSSAHVPSWNTWQAYKRDQA